MRGDFRSIDVVFASTFALVFGVGGTFIRDGVFALGMVGKTTLGGLHLVIRRERRSTSTFFDDFAYCCFFFFFFAVIIIFEVSFAVDVGSIGPEGMNFFE